MTGAETPEHPPTPSPRRRWVKGSLRALLASFMSFAGVSHFANPEFFLALMPDYLPLHEAAVYVSGAVEIILGLSLFAPAPKLREYAGWGIVALLVAVWPANIWMATQGVQPPGMGEVSPTAAWIRVAFQVVLIYWAWAVSRPDAQDLGQAQSSS